MTPDVFFVIVLLVVLAGTVVFGFRDQEGHVWGPWTECACGYSLRACTHCTKVEKVAH